MERFVTAADGQAQIRVEVYQGEHSLCRDNTKLGEYTLQGIPHAAAGDEAIDVRFTYDVNGILEVETTVLATKASSSLVLERAAGRLSPAQVEEARRANAERDDQKRAAGELRERHVGFQAYERAVPALQRAHAAAAAQQVGAAPRAAFLVDGVQPRSLQAGVDEAHARHQRLRLGVRVGHAAVRCVGDGIVVPGEEAEADVGDDPADADVVAQIRELIETRIRPAVANDGGDIVFHGFKDGVVLLHGIARSPGSMRSLERFLQRQGYATLNLGYPSRKQSRCLNEVLTSLRAAPPVAVQKHLFSGVMSWLRAGSFAGEDVEHVDVGDRREVGRELGHVHQAAHLGREHRLRRGAAEMA